MYKTYNIKEVTKENKNKHIIDEICNLERSILNIMKKEGREGQFFDTGKEGILEYVNSSENHVMVAVKDNYYTKKQEVIAATYITGNQLPYTYNDITKYFKYGDEYQQYIKELLTNKGEDYKKIVKEFYNRKINSYKIARDLILQDKKIDISKLNNKQRNKIFKEMIDKECQDNNFHEKSNLRNDFNEYMTKSMEYTNDLSLYEKFYWVDSEFLRKNKIKINTNKFTKEHLDVSDIEIYDEILNLQKYKIYETSDFDASKYYEANTNNTIEIDTYITSPYQRDRGLARIIVFEGIKKSLEQQLSNINNNKVFLISTLHKDNLSSKYVSEFFGLKDYIFTNRRNGRDREVHIFGLEKCKITDYIKDIQKKLVVLYDYNPDNIKVTDKEKIHILKEQLDYETRELDRLNKIKTNSEEKKYTGYIKGKISKVENLKKYINEIKDSEKNSEKPTNKEERMLPCLYNANEYEK